MFQPNHIVNNGYYLSIVNNDYYLLPSRLASKKLTFLGFAAIGRVVIRSAERWRTRTGGPMGRRYQLKMAKYGEIYAADGSF